MLLSEYGYFILETETFEEHLAPRVYLVGLDEYGYGAYLPRPELKFKAYPISLQLFLGGMCHPQARRLYIAGAPWPNIPNFYATNSWFKGTPRRLSSISSLQNAEGEKLVPENFGDATDGYWRNQGSTNPDWEFDNTLVRKEFQDEISDGSLFEAHSFERGINQPIWFTGRYFRIKIFRTAGPSDWISVDEITMRDVAGGADLCNDGVASASVATNKPASNAFDNSNTTYWNTGTSWVFPQWIQYLFPSPVTIKEYSIRCGYGSVPNAPSHWALEGSEDGVTWYVLDVVISQTGWTSGGQTRVFSVDPISTTNYMGGSWYKGQQRRLLNILPYQVPNPDPDEKDIKTIPEKFGYENNPYFQDATINDTHFPCGRWYYNPDDEINIKYLTTLVSHQYLPIVFTLDCHCGPGLDYQITELNFIAINVATIEDQEERGEEILPDPYGYYDETGARITIDELSPAWFIRLPVPIKITMRQYRQSITHNDMTRVPYIQPSKYRSDILYEAAAGVDADANKLIVYRLNIRDRKLEAYHVFDIGRAVGTLTAIITTSVGVFITTNNCLIIYIKDEFDVITVNTTLADKKLSFGESPIGRSNIGAVNDTGEYLYTVLQADFNGELDETKWEWGAAWVKIDAKTGEVLSADTVGHNIYYSVWIDWPNACLYLNYTGSVLMAMDYHPASGRVSNCNILGVDWTNYGPNSFGNRSAYHLWMFPGKLTEDGKYYFYKFHYQYVLYESGIFFQKVGPMPIGYGQSFSAEKEILVSYYPPGSPYEGRIYGFDGGFWPTYNHCSDSVVMLAEYDSYLGQDFNKIENFNKFMKMDGDELTYLYSKTVLGRVKTFYPRDPLWPFEEKEPTLGYINNPNWRFPATEVHHPCGYWPVRLKKDLA